MLLPVLQAEAAAVEKFTADSIQAKTAETLEVIKNTDTNVLLENLGQQALHLHHRRMDHQENHQTRS